MSQNRTTLKVLSMEFVTYPKCLATTNNFLLVLSSLEMATVFENVMFINNSDKHDNP